MAKCLRCGAGNEWIQGRVPAESSEQAEQIEQLQATNTELPKLADGVFITRALINRNVWVVRCHNNTDNSILRIVVIEIKIMEHDVELTGRDEYGVERKVDVEYCYSTLKAAAAEKE